MYYISGLDHEEEKDEYLKQKKIENKKEDLKNHYYTYQICIVMITRR